MILLGVMLILSLIKFSVANHAFNKAFANGDMEKAVSYAEKIADKNEEARLFLEANDKRENFKHTFGLLSCVIGCGNSPEWEGITNSARHAESLFKNRRYTKSIQEWVSKISVCGSIKRNIVKTTFILKPLVEGATLTIKDVTGIILLTKSIDIQKREAFSLLTGEYLVSITHPDFNEWRTNLTLRTTGNQTQIIMTELQARTGVVVISCTPKADVLLKDRKIGVTGEPISLPEGRQRLILSAKGYEKRPMIVDISREMSNPIPVLLTHNTGKLKVTSLLAEKYGNPKMPRIGKLKIGDDSWQTVELPCILPDIDTGRYTVELKVPYYKTPTPQSVNVYKNRETMLVFRLEPESVEVRFDCGEVENVQIFENERLVTVSGRTVLLPLFSHRFRLSAPGYEDMFKSVTFTPGAEKIFIVEAKMIKTKPYRLAVGIPRGDVLRWQGEPDQIINYADKYIYMYKGSRIIFSRGTDAVIKWDNTDNSLKGLD
jgi:hypothetical protein